MITTLALTVVMSSFQNVKVLSVYDGDTFFVNFPGVPDVFGKRMGIRVFGIQAPELHSKFPCEKKDAKVARSLLINLLAQGEVDLIDCTGDKYWRLDCRTLSNGWDVSPSMLSSGYSTPYHGEKKKLWICK